MPYNAGTLEISFFGKSSGEIENIKNLAKSLSSLSNVMTKIEKLDFSKAEKSFEQLTKAITPFINKVNEAQGSLESLDSIMKQSGFTSKAKGSSGFGGLGMAFSFTTAIFAARRLGRFVGDIAQAGADYAETLNLWQVSMGKNIDQATKFVDKLNEAYGVSKETLMNSQAIFKNMLGSLGEVSDAQSYILSEGITQMALDYASLYNVTFEQAMTKFQAALAGQVRPIRSTSGFDITEQTLYSLYQSLGGTKTMRQLTITEKRLLSILAIFEQMEASGATGDLKKTIDSFANQSKIMAESWKQLKSSVGAVLTKLISTTEIIPKLSGAFIALAKIFETYGKVIGAFDTNVDVFGGLGDSADEANKSIEKLNESLGLLAIDKFRVLDQDTGDGTENLGIDEIIVKRYGKYPEILEEAKNKATEFANKILETFGLLKDDGTIDTEKLDEVKEKIEQILVPLGALFAGISLLGTSDKISKAFEVLKTGFNTVLTAITSHPYVLIIMAIAAAIAYMYIRNEEFRESINGLVGVITPLMSVLGVLFNSVLVPIFNLLDAIAPLLAIVVDLATVLFTAVLYDMLVFSGFIPMLDVLMKLLQAILNTVVLLVEAISDLLSGDFSWKKIGNAFKNIGKDFIDLENTATVKYSKASFDTITSTLGKYSKQEYNLTNPVYNYPQNAGGYLNSGTSNVAGAIQPTEQIIKVYLDGEQIYDNVTGHASQRGYEWATVN